MEKPFLYTDDAPVAWTFSQVIGLVKSLEEIGCLNDIVAEADREKMSVIIPPNSINFVKEFLFQRGLHKKSEAAREIIRSAVARCAPTPAHCAPDCIPQTCIPINPQ